MVWQLKHLVAHCEVVHVEQCMMVSFFWDTCCGCLVARNWDIFLCILSSSYAATLWIGKIPWARCFGDWSHYCRPRQLWLWGMSAPAAPVREASRNFTPSLILRRLPWKSLWSCNYNSWQVWFIKMRSAIRIGPYQCFEKTLCCD